MEKAEKNGKVLKGTVVSVKMNKTVVVQVVSFRKHPRYGKYLRSSKRYKVHDEKGACVLGDKVAIRECRPISKEKSFKFAAKISSAASPAVSAVPDAFVQSHL